MHSIEHVSNSFSKCYNLSQKSSEKENLGLAPHGSSLYACKLEKNKRVIVFNLVNFCFYKVDMMLTYLTGHIPHR